MAIIYNATLRPDKTALLTAWLDRQSWGGEGVIEHVGAYRLDDPEGEVGLEGFILRRSGRTLHVPVTYRGAPLEEAEEALVGTTSHSVLGERWVYDAVADPVGRTLILRALQGEQSQAQLDMYAEDGTFTGTEDNTVIVSVVGASDGHQDLTAVHEPSSADTIARGGQRALVATWPGGEGTLFHG